VRSLGAPGVFYRKHSASVTSLHREEQRSNAGRVALEYVRAIIPAAGGDELEVLRGRPSGNVALVSLAVVLLDEIAGKFAQRCIADDGRAAACIMFDKEERVSKLVTELAERVGGKKVATMACFKRLSNMDQVMALLK